MSTNPYLERLRTRYDGLKSGIEGLQTRAADEERDLTEDELRSIKEQSDEAKTLATQIEDLTEVETRNRKVEGLAASLVPTDESGETRFHTQDRDPGHYTRSSEHSFFADMYSARGDNDADAARRLVEHNRALTTAGAGAGIVPPKWLTDEYAAMARQGRSLASAVRNIPLGSDPRPLTLPKQTTGADAVVPAEQAAENDVTPSTDKFASSVDTVVPKPTRGKQIVSRQLVEMSTPAVDALIYGDLLSEYNRQVELKVGTAVKAAGVALTAQANEAAFQAAQGSVVDLAIGVRKARKVPANILATTIERYGEFLKLKDSTGRPLIGEETAGQAFNVVGVGTVAVDGRIRGLGIVATEGMGAGTYPDTYAALRASDTLLFESDVMRFRYEERSGPESIELGIWAYTAVLVRYATDSVRKINVTIA